ncbi:MAG: hypothetical protein QM730_08535 [Anaerolineales bacterium]
MHAPTLITSSSSPIPLAEWELQFQIQQALSNKFTGQIQIAFTNSRTESIFVLNGVVKCLYVHNHRLPTLNWESPLARFGRGTIIIQPLPARALMFRKVIREEITAPQPQFSGTNQLKTMVSLAEHNPNPTLFHIRWEKAEGYVLVAGGHIPIRQSVFITPSLVEEGNLAHEHMAIWDEPRCNVSIYRGDIKNQAWLELHLNILFEWYAQNMLNYYKQLTGKVMVRSILQSLSMLAESRKWNISTQEQNLHDLSLFPTAADTGNAYRSMLSIVRLRIEPVIGSSLTSMLVKQSTEATRGTYRTIQEVFELIEDAQ